MRLLFEDVAFDLIEPMSLVKKSSHRENGRVAKTEIQIITQIKRIQDDKQYTTVEVGPRKLFAEDVLFLVPIAAYS